MSAAAEKQALYRWRVATGRAVLAIEVDLVDTAEMLIEAGMLRTEEADDREAVADALARQVRNLIELHRLVTFGQTT